MWMIYGATGYTGRLVVAEALARGEKPVLAGRSAGPLAELAASSGLEYRAVDLAEPAALRAALADIDAVAHCAGPFVRTAAPMVAACLATGTHYLDITGELEVFESVFAAHDAAVEAGVVLLPGAGFDVVPTDCLAGLLAAALPGATRLELAFRAGGGVSRGTAKVALAMGAAGARRRIDGELRPTRLGEPRRVAPFPSGPREVGALTWGDLVTAARSTGIPNITVYTRLPATGGWRATVAQRLLRMAPMRRLAERRLRRRPPGPSAQTRAATGIEVWGEVRDPEGATRSATLTGPNPYDLTADALLQAVGHVLAGTGPAGPIPAGAHTPATALGAGFVRNLTGVEVSGPTD
jgi:short subunit dehydrogenase-like uncharacterized protein